MKLATIRIATAVGTVERVVAMIGEDALDLAATYEAMLTHKGVSRAEEIAQTMFPNMRDTLAAWPLASEIADSAIAFAAELDQTGARSGERGTKALIHKNGSFDWAPAVRPLRIRDYMTYEEHKKKSMERRGLEMPELWYRMPTYTNRNITALAAHEEQIGWPSYSEHVDIEFEIALVVGRSGRDIEAGDAMSYVAGFTIYNDLSARDVQKDERTCGSGPGKSKDFDQGNIIGPVIATLGEIDPTSIALTLMVDGETWSTGNTSQMCHSWQDLIANASRGETIHPGDLIASGTFNGGSGIELGRKIEPGSIVELHAEGIGVLRNVIGSKQALS